MYEIIEWCNSNDGFIMAILTLVYVATTLGLYFSNKNAVKLGESQLKELIREQEIRERPYVVLSLDIIRNGLICLKIENLGFSPAYDLTVHLESSFIDNVKKIMNSDNIVELTASKMYLAPQQKYYIALSSTADFKKLSETPISGEIMYSGKYKDELFIDIKNYSWALLYNSPLGDISEHLRNIKETQKQIANNLNSEHLKF